MEKVRPFLWFASRAGDALAYYQAIFPDFKQRFVEYGPTTGPNGKNRITLAVFSLGDQEIACVDLLEDVSFGTAMGAIDIDCSTKSELERLTAALDNGGGKIIDQSDSGHRGWLIRDKFGIAWRLCFQDPLNHPKASAGNVCMANSPEVRPEYRD